jgi:hypothetical protein
MIYSFLLFSQRIYAWKIEDFPSKVTGYRFLFQSPRINEEVKIFVIV